jgi:transglutaminase-like putative cysteine protease
MRSNILHTTTYRYAQPVAFNPHRLMLLPRGTQDLQVLSHALRCSPPAAVTWAQDVFGNLVATAQFEERAADLTITSELLVQATADRWPVFPVAPHAQVYPFVHSADEVTDLGAMRLPTNESSTVSLWAEGFIRSRPTDTLARLKYLNAGVLASVRYNRRDEEGVQTGQETLALASGSCRDFAALFIEGVRHLGFGARAVSGYLIDPQAVAPIGDTTHAWAEVYVPGAGWVAFDPTHARVGNAGLIPVAIGRCNAQIAPVIGSYVGAADDLIGMEVTVEAGPG